MRTLKVIMAALLALAASVGTLAPAQVPAPRAPLAPQPAIVAASTTPTSGPTSGPTSAIRPAIGARTLDAADVNAWLDGFMPFALHSNDLAGAVVMVVKDGQIIAARGYGYADIARHIPVDPARTLFRPGSVSKLVTWVAVMQQVEAGKLDLDVDVNRYLDFKLPPREGRPVTLREIMTHTAGFEETAKDLITYRDPLPLGAYLKRWTPRRIYPAGTTPAYSNWATSLAGYIVGRVSGMSFDDYVDSHIFKPLDMRTASFRQPLPANLRPLAAVGYPRASEPAQGYEMVVPAPAGSLAASGLDMAKFMIANLAGGRGLMSPATAAMMHDSPTAKVDPMTLIPPLNRMELGFFETNINGHEVIGHLGDTVNFHTSLHLFMNDGVGLYVSFNSAGKEGGAHLVRAQLFQDFADRYFPQTVKDGRVDAKTAAEHARMMAGYWLNSRHSESNFVDALNLFGQTKITTDADGRLLIPALTGASGAVQKWVEIAPFVWRDANGHDRLAAKVVDGRVVRWSFDMVSPFMVFDRVPFDRSAGWLLPALYVSLGVLALTLLFWPSAWFVRRRYKQPVAVSGQALRTYRAVRIMAGLSLAVLIGWAVFVTTAFSNLEMMTSANDWMIWLLQIAGIIVFVGAVGIAAWNVWLTWHDGRGWAARLWSVLVLLASLIVLYVASIYGLIAMTANY